ncbi:Uncharacterised protein [Mycobacteroides abscessus subsp. abscessus]|nr:Uncharacterised protein [Mycobacteroides abscessus subsp. abscessus]
MAQDSDRGTGVPPSSSWSPTRSQPASVMALTDFLKASGMATEWVSGSKTGGLRSPSANESASGPSARVRISARKVRAVSSSSSGNSSPPNTCWILKSSKRLNSRSRTFDL